MDTTDDPLARGLERLGSGDWTGAEAAFTEAARQNPADPAPLVGVGRARVGRGRPAEAVRAYEEALLRDHRSLEARYHLAEALVRTGELSRASAQLHYVGQIDPLFAPAVLLRGDIAYHQGDHRQALVEYCQAVRLGPVDAPVYERMGQAFRAIGDARQALEALLVAVGLDKTRYTAVIEAARLAEGLGRRHLARKHFLAVLYLPEHRAEATAAITRLDAALAGAPPEPEDDEPHRFRPPRTHMGPGTAPLRPPAPARPPVRGTPPSLERPVPHAAPGTAPLGAPPPGQPPAKKPGTAPLSRPGTGLLSGSHLQLPSQGRGLRPEPEEPEARGPAG